MQPVRSTLQSLQHRPNRGPAGGFTLSEVSLALLATALVATIAVGEARKYRHAEQRDELVAELRSLAVAFETFRLQNGEWPAATHAESRVPRGMEAALAKTAWLAGPPCGGSYDWMPPPNAKAAAPGKLEEKQAVKLTEAVGMIAITAFSTGSELTLTDEDLRYIDAKLDDGNLATGRFRTGFNRWPVYLTSLNR